MSEAADGLLGLGTVPAPVTDLLGRADEVALVLDLLTVERRRLVTLTGLGGVGKTRLAVEVAHRAHEQFRHGAVLVDLSAVVDADSVAAELCRQLGIAVLAGSATLDRLAAVLRGRHQLVVVDNFEQVIAAAALLGDLVGCAPDLSLLVTSRRPLHLAGEQVVPLAPLDTDAGDDPAGSPAGRLFCARARAVNPQFAPDRAGMIAVAEICRRLDGVPLAIELAAARSRALAPAQLLERLTAADGGHWPVLGRATVGAATRHRGLREAIDWSLALLNPVEETLFTRLGVFRGTWSLDAAETVGADLDAAGPLQPQLVLDALTTLVDLHLVEPLPEPHGGGQRFRLLDTIGSVARERLRGCGEVVAVQRRHAEYYLQLVLAADAGLESSAEAAWYHRIDPEVSEVAAAFDWLAAQGQFGQLARAAAALGPYWLNRGQFAAGRRWLDVAIDHQDQVPAEAGAVCRGWAARLALDRRAGVLRTQDAALLLTELEHAAAATAELGEPRRELRAVEHLTYALRLYGDAQRARDLTLEALSRCPAELGWWRAEHLVRLSLLHGQLGEAPQARERAREAVTAAISSGNDRARARALQAEALSSGDLDPTKLEARMAQVLALTEASGDRRGRVTTQIVLAVLAGARGDDAAFGQRLEPAIVEAQEISYEHGVGLAVTALVTHAVERGEWQVAADLHGGVLTQLPALRRQLPGSAAAQYDEAITRTRRLFGATEFDRAVRDGAARRWDQSAAAALDRARAVGRTQTSPLATGLDGALAIVAPNDGAPDAGRLSEREVEVLTLIADGLTNAQIAERLYLSPKTVMHHSSHIYRKLGVRGRAEAAAQAIRFI